MPWPARFNSLLAQFILRVIAPLTLVMILVIIAGLYVYQQAVTSLLVDRDRQLATLSATQLSEVMAGYTRELEGLAASPNGVGQPVISLPTLSNPQNILQVFSAGVILVNPDGQVIQVAPSGVSPVGPTVAAQAYFQTTRQSLAATFSDVVVDARTGKNMIVISVPVLDEARTFAGAMLGAVDLDNTALSEPIDNLHIGNGGIAYLVDSRGRIIFHPDHQNIGTDYTDRPFVTNVIAGESGGTLWQSRTTGEQVVVGYAHVANTNWGLIIREPWVSVVGPIQTYGLLLAVAAVAGVVVAALLLWQGVRRIAIPVRLLVEQTIRLAAGESVEPIAAYGIREIDALDQAFNQMATQIVSYRAGLRRYVDAMTQLQEDERRHIARELHDETVQSLLTIARRVELYQASEDDPVRLARLAELQGLITETMQGVRQISRDLRPLILEDLGLIPALRTLIREARGGNSDAPHAKLDVSGQHLPLSLDQELALYRITQEALTNVRKHARATKVCIELVFDQTQVQLGVSDDGCGFEVPPALTELAQRDSFGLVGIQERVWAIGGSLSLHSKPGEGTRLRVTIPVQSQTAQTGS